MRSNRVLILCLVILVTMIGFTACGSGADTSGGSAAATPATPVEQVVEQSIAQADTQAANGDAMIGHWIDIADSARFCDITKDGETYTYKDQDGSYSGTFQDGMIVLKLDETSNAKVYLNDKNGDLMLVYGANDENVQEFKK